MTTRFRNYLTENGDDFANISHILLRDCMQFLKEIKKAKKFLYRGTHKTGHHQDDRGIDEFYPREDRQPKDTAEWMHDLLDMLFNDKFHWKARSEGVFATGSIHVEQYGTSYLFFPVNGYKFVWSPSVEDLTSHLGGYAVPEEEDFDSSAVDDSYETYEEECGPNSGHGEWRGSDGTVYGTMKDLKKNKNIAWIDPKGYNTGDRDSSKFYINVHIKRLYHEELEWIPEEEYADWSDAYYRRIQEDWYENGRDLAADSVSSYKDRDLAAAIKSTHEISFKCKKYYLVNKIYQEELEKLIFQGKLSNRADQKQETFPFMKEAEQKTKYVSHRPHRRSDEEIWVELEAELNKNCRQYKKEKLGRHFLYRGMSGHINDYTGHRSRNDRIPQDIPIEYHKFLDELFLKKVGWKVRSEGVFVTGSTFIASTYGGGIESVYIVVPYDVYDYVWSPAIEDLFGSIQELTNHLSLPRLVNAPDIKEHLREFVDTYVKNKGLSKAVTRGHEISIKCNGYYQINRKHEDRLYKWQSGK